MMLEIAGIRFGYRSAETIADIGFEADKGDVVSVLGPNGVGKTTLLKCINRIHRPKEGRVLVDGDDIMSKKPQEIAKLIGYVPQRMHVSGSTVFESVLIGRRPHIKMNASEKDIRLAGRVISLLGLEDISEKRVSEISGGEYQLVQIARAVVQQPGVIILDEPVSNLDLKNRHTVMTAISEIVKENDMCAVMTNHDLNLALMYSNRFILMKDGKIYAAGGREIISPENIRDVYGIEVTVGEVEGTAVIVPRRYDNVRQTE